MKVKETEEPLEEGEREEWKSWLKTQHSKNEDNGKRSHDKPRQYNKKQRHYFADKGPSTQSYGFSSGCESWTVKKPSVEESMLLNCGVGEDSWRVPWTARRSNQSILKEISLEYSLEGLMLKLKLQYFGHLMWRADSLEKTLMLGGTGGRRRGGQQRMRWLDGIWLNGHGFGWTPGVGDGQGRLACCISWGHKE